MYRKIKIYRKSIDKARAERQRRKQILELSKNGFTQKQIAEQLGVSVRTIGRDLKKLQRYISYLTFESKMELNDLLTARLNEIPLEERFEVCASILVAHDNKNHRRENKLLFDLLGGKKNQ